MEGDLSRYRALKAAKAKRAKAPGQKLTEPA
jgi:hypothetical protein